MALVQDVRITDDPVDDQYPADTSQVNVDTVIAWIGQVSAAASGGLWQAVRIIDDDRTLLIKTAAAAAVACGAASYVEAAVSPRRVDGPADGGYAAVLWTRYEQMITDLAGRITVWIDEGGIGVVTAGRGPVANFPCTVFTDNIQW